MIRLKLAIDLPTTILSGSELQAMAPNNSIHVLLVLVHTHVEFCVLKLYYAMLSYVMLYSKIAYVKYARVFRNRDHQRYVPSTLSIANGRLAVV